MEYQETEQKVESFTAISWKNEYSMKLTNLEINKFVNKFQIFNFKINFNY